MHTQQEIITMFGLRNATITGDEILCSCPYTANHKNGDRHPSFRLNTAKGVFICFGCGATGNLVQLACDILGMSRMKAEMTFDTMSVDAAIEMIEGRDGEMKQLTPVQMDVGAWAENKHPYWKMRGFTDETIGKWKLGYDPVENRVVVPVYMHGELVGWTKRAVDDYTQPKWRHLPGFDKSLCLFGMDNFTDDSVVLVEAPLSAIMLDQYGVHNAVASMGCKLSEAQARLLRANYNSVAVWYDPDDAGRAGTADAVAKLENFMDVYVVPPARDDPAAMSLEEDIQALRSAVPLWALSMA